MNKLFAPHFFILILLLLSCGKSDKALSEEARIKASSNYSKYCAGCHYADLGWFKNRQWKHGNSHDSIFKSIKNGYPANGMPSFDSAFTDLEIQNLAKLIIVSLGSSGSKNGNPDQQGVKTEKMNIQLIPVIVNLDSPWGMVFLPDGDMLISERVGKIIRYRNGDIVAELQGVPDVHAEGQGGLFDLRLHPDFKNNGLLYFAYNSPSANGWNTAVMRARLQDNSLVDKEIIFKAVPDTRSNIQFGGRITFDGKGHILFSTGDCGKQDMAQDLSNDWGKIHRLNDDGSVPSDNPFVNQSGARPTIWSYGHRNPEGLTYNTSTGVLWEHEHGPMGGDELNIIEKGKNYGWPVITYGKNYDGTIITNQTSKPGMEQPVTYWTPSIAPCGMDFVTGSNYKGWEGNILLGSLKFKYLVRCELSGNSVSHQEIMFRNLGRLRNVVMAPDGYVYIATELPGTVYKLVPVP
jgi:glucose/arabinose dehydrogenase